MTPSKSMNAPSGVAFCAELAALLRRDWAVRVLDAWALISGGPDVEANAHHRTRPLSEGWECEIQRTPWSGGRFHLSWSGDDAAAARLAAAEAVWPELPESVRAELGERP